MRDTFVRTLIDIAKQDKNVILVTGDLGFGVLRPFWEQLPDQFINAGIAEQNMTGMAAGMALEGKIVFTYSIGNFPTLRCLEQIRNDCAYHNANVKIVCVGGGFSYGSLGMSHHATEDIAVMRALPNVTVMAPGDLVEAEYSTKAIYKAKGTCYLRLGRGGEKRIHDKIDDFEIGKSLRLIKGKNIAVFTTGAIVNEVLVANDILKEKGINISLFTFPTVKPIDKKLIDMVASENEFIITVEEHNVVGGFGSAVAEIMAKGNYRARLYLVGLEDEFSETVGNQDYLRELFGIDANSVVNAVLKLCCITA